MHAKGIYKKDIINYQKIFFYFLIATNHIHEKSTSPKLLEVYHIFTFGVGNDGFTVSNSIWLGHWHVFH